MHVLVVGGSGTSGRPLVHELLGRGHRVRALSRRGRAPDGAEAVRGDLHTGEGLAAALDGVEAVVDCANQESMRRRDLSEHFVAGTRRLLAAAAAAGTGHYVLLSIAGIRGVPFRYYEAKLAQEEVAARSGVPSTVVPACQFHEYPSLVLAVTGPLVRLGIAPVPSRTPLRPVATATVAEALADAVEARPAGRTADVRGPREELLDDLVRRELRARGSRARVVPVLLPGTVGRRLREGALLGDPSVPGRGPTFDAWLQERAGSAAGSDPDRGDHVG